MKRDLAVVFDCGSTNLTVVVVDAGGQLVASWSSPSGPVHQEGKPDGHMVWDLDALWERLCTAGRQCMEEIDPDRLCGVTVTTWGADGAPVSADGELLYPPISWQDNRTEDLARDIESDIDAWTLYQTSGYQIIGFNTLLKLRWLHDNEPRALADAKHWLMMPGLLSMLLCGAHSLDATAAGTMMAMDMAQRRFSDRLLEWAGVSAELFPPIIDPGAVIGKVGAAAAKATGLPEHLPVIAAGHDTQFAAVGSGAGPGEVILSSGTWEILMLRSDTFAPSKQDFEDGLLIEADAEPGKFNPQMLMMGSGVLEWLRDQFYTDSTGRETGYGDMVSAAEKIRPGCDGTMVVPSFVPDTGPLRHHQTEGTVVGLGLSTTRDHLYRAALEGLSCQLRQAVEILSRGCKAPCTGIRVVGGGSKNPLWNQIRADVCKLPVTTIEQKEATVLGAAMFAFVGGGTYGSIAEAQEKMVGTTQVFEPSGKADAYEAVFAAYSGLPPALESFYRRAH